MVLEMLDVSEVITKTACVVFPDFSVCRMFITTHSEFARVFGVDFFSVISRGSQFKVESFMFRIAKPESFVLISPSKSDVRVPRLSCIVLRSGLSRSASKTLPSVCLSSWSLTRLSTKALLLYSIFNHCIHLS